MLRGCTVRSVKVRDRLRLARLNIGRILRVAGKIMMEEVHIIVIELKAIADRMIRSGYEKECCQVYSNVRRDVLDECLSILGVEKLSIEEVQNIEWKILDEKMKKWIQAVKVVVKVLLFGEKRSCGQVSRVLGYFAFGENT
ncbi:putative exocyst complex component Exo70, cullin repeat-like-containing domain superfamily [Helianthus anomalus]